MIIKKVICSCLTLAGGQVNGFSPRFKLNTEVMKRSSTGKETMRLPLKSNVVSWRYEISGKKQKNKTISILIFFMGIFFITILLSYSNLSQCSKNLKFLKGIYGQGCRRLIISLLAKINIFEGLLILFDS